MTLKSDIIEKFDKAISEIDDNKTTAILKLYKSLISSTPAQFLHIFDQLANNISADLDNIIANKNNTTAITSTIKTNLARNIVYFIPLSRKIKYIAESEANEISELLYKIKNKADEIDKNINESSEKLSSLQNEISNEINRLRDRMDNFFDSESKELRRKIDHIIEELKNNVYEIEREIKEKLEAIELDSKEKHDKILELYNLVSGNSVSGSHKENAKKELNSYRIWISIFFILLFSGVGLSLYMYNSIDFEKINDKSYIYMNGIKFTTTIAIYLAAAYAARQAAIRRRMYYVLRQFSIEMLAIDPYINDMDNKNSIKQNLVDRYFGKIFDVLMVEKKPPGIFERILSAIIGRGKNDN